MFKNIVCFESYEDGFAGYNTGIIARGYKALIIYKWLLRQGKIPYHGNCPIVNPNHIYMVWYESTDNLIHWYKVDSMEVEKFPYETLYDDLTLKQVIGRSWHQINRDVNVRHRKEYKFNDLY